MIRKQRCRVAPVIEFPVQRRMHARQVVSLKIVVDVNLPVALHVIFAASTQLHLSETVLSRLLRQFTQRVEQRQSVRIKIHKDLTLPLTHLNWPQPKLLCTEGLDAFHLWSIHQPSIERVGPSVIAAPKNLARSASLRSRPSPMPAHIVETAQHPVGAAHYHEWLAEQIHGNVIAWVTYLLRSTRDLPRSPENFV